MRTVEQRFWAFVERTTTCWLWKGERTERGYGKFRHAGKNKRAHRVSWEMHYGPIPKGMCVLHSCDNPPCIRPKHLFLGTRKDNTWDAIRKGRATTTYMPGEGNRYAKLSRLNVLYMRKLRKLRWTYARIGAAFGVTESAADHAIRGITWSKIDVRK